MSFSKDFVWGLGTAAYQIEGAYNEGGRGASIWDTFSGANTVGMPGSVCDKAPCSVSSVMKAPGQTGNVANDHYHRYKDDVAMMKSLGLKVYRFSIAWPRIYPSGRAEDGVNKEGVAFYHNLIKELLDAGIAPVVTMYHWDLPQGLMDAAPGRKVEPCDPNTKQGWFECTKSGLGDIVPSGMQSETVRQFGLYAEFLFKEYGSTVKTWVTFNEAWTFTYLGSGYGKAPAVQPYMDNDVWPYVAGHNVILAHLTAMKTFRRLQATGLLSKEHIIGITNNQDWREPYSHAPTDIAAAQAQLEGQLGWYADPIYGVNGVHDYPDSMYRLRPYMPSFSEEEKAELEAHKPDFFGFNHYGTGFTKFDTVSKATTVIEDGLVQGESVWLFGSGWGFRKLLNWISNRYGKNLPLYCTESGWSVSAKHALQGKYDPGRVMYYSSYLTEAWNAINIDKVNLKGFMAWSLMDNYEWEMGYTERFGLVYNDFKFGVDPNGPGADTPVYNAKDGTMSENCGLPCVINAGPTAAGQTRHAKNTILWMRSLWKSGELPDPAPFLTSTPGGDICYGHGTITVSGQTVECSLDPYIPQLEEVEAKMVV